MWFLDTTFDPFGIADVGCKSTFSQRANFVRNTIALNSPLQGGITLLKIITLSHHL